MAKSYTTVSPKGALSWPAIDMSHAIIAAACILASLVTSASLSAQPAAPDLARIDKLLDEGFAGVVQGRYVEMVSLGEAALALSTAAGDQYRIARSLILTGSGYYNQTRLPEALDRLQRGQQIAVAIDDVPLQKLASQMLASTLRSLGRFNDALAQYENWRIQNKRLEKPESEGRIGRSIAVLYMEMSDITQAEAMFRETVSYARSAGEVQLEASALLGLAGVQKTRGQLREALATAESALERARVAKAVPVQAEILNSMGDAHRQLGQLDQAGVRLREARDLAASVRYQGLLAQVAERLGHIEADRGRHAEAIEAFQQARETYLALGELPEKRWTVERAWGLSAKALKRGNEAVTHLREAVQLVERLQANTVPRDLERALPISTRRALFEDAAVAILEVEGAEAALEMADRSRARAFLYTLGETDRVAALPELAAVDRIRRELIGPGRVFVEYMLGEQRSLVWTVSEAGVRVATLPPRAEIEALVTAERAALGQSVTALTLNRARRESDARQRALYRVLIAPIDDVIGAATQLIIVPDGGLAYVPFEALRPTDTSYLIERAAITYAQSAASALALRSRRTRGTERPAGSIAAFGNPAYNGAQWMPLPHSQGEVNTIARRYPARQVFLGGRATETSVKTADLSGVRYLHFAVHGFTDPDDPARSGLALSSDSSGKEDGVLRMGEIAALRLDADLVTLSACRTATGKLLNGEGLLSLGRAFFYAGARQVVGSLWDVNDASTSQLMSAFYAKLDAGAPVAEALRQAKLAMIRGPRAAWAHPHHWSPFIALQ